MLLQRLIADPDVGFNYDYMGAAEYEFGATLRARNAMAQAYIENDVAALATRFVEFIGNTRCPAIDVLVLARKKTITELTGKDLVVRVSKEAFRTTNKKYVGWMKVERSIGTAQPIAEPLLIIRRDLDNIQQRVNDFFEPAIEHMRGELSLVS